ncbi:MAG TPA: hypothetical protein PLW86_11375 [Rhodocyclaceae bacterium]|nr:hypothetical protein [Rhodocyclaceae bacterium]
MFEKAAITPHQQRKALKSSRQGQGSGRLRKNALEIDDNGCVVL